jgi:hypothetical protein
MNDSSMTLKSFTLLEPERGETSFYVGSHVNQLLGLSRGALYSKYPDLRCRPARREEKHLLNKLGIIGTANMVKVTVVSKCDVHEIVNNHYVHLKWALDQSQTEASDHQARQFQSARLLKKLQRKRAPQPPPPTPPPSPTAPHRRRNHSQELDVDDDTSSQNEMILEDDNTWEVAAMELVKSPSPHLFSSAFPYAGTKDEIEQHCGNFRAAMLSRITSLADDARTFDQETRASGAIAPSWSLSTMERELNNLKNLTLMVEF